MSSPDRIPPHETKPERERRVFSFFAADTSAFANFLIRPGTIESRDPPEPDILCQVQGEGAIAFELTEILDEGSKKTMETMKAAREALLSHPLSNGDLRAFQAKFAEKHIKVGFRLDVPLKCLESAVPDLYRWLIYVLPDNEYGYSVPLPTELREAIEYVSVLFPGPPLIDVAYGLNLSDATISVVTRKLTVKRYTTTAPIELLVFAHDQPLINHDLRQPAISAEIVPLIDDSIARRHIRRVWIYDISRRRTDQAIKFVYPARET